MLVAIVGAYPFAPQPRFQPRTAAPAIVNLRPKIALKPGQACAIPLINVLKKPWTYDSDMVKRILPAPPVNPAEVVTPPAPSCDDAR